MTEAQLSVPTWTPPKWLNAVMQIMLSTPGLPRILGRTTALFTFTGRRTGNSYTTPVTHYRSGDKVIVLSAVVAQPRDTPRCRAPAGRTDGFRTRAGVGGKRQHSHQPGHVPREPSSGRQGVRRNLRAPNGRINEDSSTLPAFETENRWCRRGIEGL